MLAINVKSRPYFCHGQALVLGTFSFLYYFQQKISQPLHHGAPWNWTQSEGETKSSQNDSTHSEALSSLGLHCHQRGFGEIFFSYWPRPGLGSLPWSAPLWAPFTRAPSRRSSHAWSARWSTAESPRLLRATEWAEWSVKLWVSFSPPIGFQRTSWWSAWDIFCWRY